MPVIECPNGSGNVSYDTDDLDQMLVNGDVSNPERGIQILCDIDDLDGGKRKSKKFRKHKYKGKSYTFM